jgi:biopolymer transport protein ExbB
MNEYYNLAVSFFKDGGFFMYPIAWLYLSFERIRNIKAFEEFLPLLRTTDMEKMQLFTRENHAPITRIIGCGLDMMKVSRHRADIENSMSEGMLETLPKLERRINYLAVLANVATLLGLLGTIVGLISAFTAVSNANPAEKAQLLSQSISVAMNTTAFGLIVAIPLMVLHAMAQNKTTTIVTSIQMSAVKFLNIMTVHRLIETNIPRQVEKEAAAS